MDFVFIRIYNDNIGADKEDYHEFREQSISGEEEKQIVAGRCGRKTGRQQANYF